MRIGIACDVALGDRPTGIGLHVRNLLAALAAVDRENEYLLYVRRNPLALRAEASGLEPPGPNFRVRPVRFPANWVGDHPRLWWNHYLPHILRRDRLDVFHGPNHFLPALRGGASVVTIHDLAYFRMELYPTGENEMLREWTLQSLRQASGVVALSENTSRDIKALGVDPERVRVIHGGGHIVPEEEIRRDRWDELRRAFDLPDHYILFVGSLLPRKNVPFLLRGFARLKAAGFPHKLVLAGARDSSSDDVVSTIASLKISEDVIITGYVESWQLPLLYRAADLFVLPTLYEGFTLVTLEAMAYGTPVVATDTSSIREGVGENALLVSVDDDEALVEAMQRALTDEPLRSRLIRGGRERARQFTWERCATETLKYYRDLSESAARSANARLVASGHPC